MQYYLVHGGVLLYHIIPDIIAWYILASYYTITCSYLVHGGVLLYHIIQYIIAWYILVSYHTVTWYMVVSWCRQ